MFQTKQRNDEPIQYTGATHTAWSLSALIRNCERARDAAHDPRFSDIWEAHAAALRVKRKRLSS